MCQFWVCVYLLCTSEKLFNRDRSGRRFFPELLRQSVFWTGLCLRCAEKLELSALPYTFIGSCTSMRLIFIVHLPHSSVVWMFSFGRRENSSLTKAQSFKHNQTWLGRQVRLPGLSWATNLSPSSKKQGDWIISYLCYFLLAFLSHWNSQLGNKFVSLVWARLQTCRPSHVWLCLKDWANGLLCQDSM
jgi:hypothetical protein